MLKLKIGETVLNACDTLSANDPYKRWHCRHCWDIKTITRYINYDEKKNNSMIVVMNFQLQMHIYIYISERKRQDLCEMS